MSQKALIAILIALEALASHAQPVSDRDAHWRQDIQFFADQFSRRQVDFEKLYPSFREEIAGILEGILSLTDAEIVMRLMRLVASANVVHNHVWLPIFRLGFQQLPLEFTWFSDGLAVVAAKSAYSAALGARVVRIGPMTPEQLLAAVTPYISHENDGNLQRSSTGFLKTLEVLQHIGGAGADGRVELTLAKPNGDSGGEPFTLSVQVGDPRAKLVNLWDLAPVPPLFRKQSGYYWYEYLADSKALYIQYNVCENDPKLRFGEFASGLFAFADSHAVERVMVDLRFNSGGNSRVIGPLMGGLKSRPALRRSLYVLVGPATASSAQDAALDFRRGLHAILVGQATAESINGYGESRDLYLPNSNLRIGYSTHYFHMAKNDAPALDPDIPVRPTLADAITGRDAALETALKHSAK
jgi:hypothetical protein